MSFWDGVASFGIGATGYSDYMKESGDRAYVEAKRKRDEEISNLELEKIRREDAVAKQARDIAKQYGLGGANQLPGTAESSVEIPPLSSVDDQGNPMPGATKAIPGLPAQENRVGMYDAMAKHYESNGDLAKAEQIRKAMKSLETEGYTEIIKGAAAGEDPSAIAQRFNKTGSRRIVDSQKNGDTYSFTYEDGKTQTMSKAQAADLGTKLGVFKKDLTIIPEGAKVIDASGATVAEGNAKRVPAHNIDPLSPEGIAATEQRERMKARLKTELGGGAKATAMVQNIEYLSEKLGISIEEAYEKSRTGMTKPEVEMVLDAALKLRTQDQTGKYDKNPDAAIEDAKKVVQQARDAVAKKPKAKPAAASDQPEQLGGPGSPGFDANLPKTLKAPSGKDATFTGKYNKAGKPIYSDGTALFVGE